jgi:hypothetical protein
MEIKKGDRFRCTQSLLVGGLIHFTEGKTYESVHDCSLPNNVGNRVHYLTADFWPTYFEKVEDNQEYLKLRGLDTSKWKNHHGFLYDENNVCRGHADPVGERGEPGVDGDHLFPDENPSIRKTFISLHDLLQFKNKRYGNSSLEPINVLSKADSTTGLLQRADDKIARIKNSPELRKNDVADLIGYLVLICVSKGWDNFDEFKD